METQRNRSSMLAKYRQVEFNINTSNRLFQKKIQIGRVEDFAKLSLPQISPLFSLHKFYNSYTLFSANIAFPWHVVLLISKTLTWMFMHFLWYHSRQPLHFAIKYSSSDLISSWRHNIFPRDTIYIKKQRNRSTAIKSFTGLWKSRNFF